VTRIFRRDATKLGPSLKQLKYSLVLLDPPYGQGLAERALKSALEGGWLDDRAIIVIEEEAQAEVDLPDGFELVDHRAYATTQISIARYGNVAG